MKRMLQEILNNLSDDSVRFELIDHEHFIDKQNGLKYHLYNPDDPGPFKPLKITDTEMNNAYISNFLDYNQDEQAMFEQIRVKLHNLVAEKSRAKFKEMYARKLD